VTVSGQEEEEEYDCIWPKEEDHVALPDVKNANPGEMIWLP